MEGLKELVAGHLESHNEDIGNNGYIVRSG